MKYFTCFVLCCTIAAAQRHSPIKILEYSVVASIDERLERIDGTASVWLQVSADSVNGCSFTVPLTMEVNAVRDIDDDRFSKHKIVRDYGLYKHAIELPSYRFRGDSFFVKIEFEEEIDSSSASPLFISSREFILPYAQSYAWLPVFAASVAGTTSLEIALPFAFSIVSSAAVESQASDNQFRWNIRYDSEVPLSEAFSLCGSVAIDEWKKTSEDSLISISFIVPSGKFNRGFADSLLTMLVNAAVYYRRFLAADSVPYIMNYLFVGDDPVRNEHIRAGNCVIQRNSPAYMAFDSSAFTRSANNPWLFELAYTFCPFIDDSTIVFTDGWAGYLASRYLFSLHQNPLQERKERLDLMIRALSFYPAAPVASGKNIRTSERQILTAKVKYFFLMLEYLLGREQFDSVMKETYGESFRRQIQIKDFQALCEEEYGSPLDGFFRQWLYRPGAPEVVMEWKAEKTTRGTVSVVAAVEQRGDLFVMPMDLYFTVGSKAIPKRIVVEHAKQEFVFEFSSVPGKVELDPYLHVLRWQLDIRILAHARSSTQFLECRRDLFLSEREAALTLQLDPVNTTGAAPIAYYSLGKLAVIHSKLEQAREYFLSAMQSAAVEESQIFTLLSVVRYANVLEMEGKRNEAIPLYQRVISEGRKDMVASAPAVIAAEAYLRENFISTDEVWYGLY